jgi:hypothetical protein
MDHRYFCRSGFQAVSYLRTLRRQDVKTKKYPKKAHPEIFKGDYSPILLYNMRQVPNKVQALLVGHVHDGKGSEMT